MRCPIDGRELTPMEYEGALVFTCESCGGDLLSGDTLSHIVRTRESTFGELWPQLVQHSRPIMGTPAKSLQRGLGCPVCAAKMTTVNYFGSSDIFIDRCLQCQAVWLDRQELERVQALVEQWQDQAPGQLAAISIKLEDTRKRTVAASESAFQGSRLSFVNALMNRLLDAA